VRGRIRKPARRLQPLMRRPRAASSPLLPSTLLARPFPSSLPLPLPRPHG